MYVGGKLFSAQKGSCLFQNLLNLAFRKRTLKYVHFLVASIFTETLESIGVSIGQLMALITVMTQNQIFHLNKAP